MVAVVTRNTSPARSMGWGFMAGGAALVPWMCVLAARLPATTQVANWSTAWIGLDVMLATGLLSTGYFLTRGDQRYGLTAAATGALLLMDAWFDVTTATSDTDRTFALALAIGLELPLAGVCATLAARALGRDGKARKQDPRNQVKPGAADL
ncbi:hypothetical protein [Spirillospora sp. CA-294931]|uniref:hypothetical protein n=1 Tax=Spirillospora sp. CA-294931 TaxID=3240042 RepID=UPI003D8B359F